MKKLELPEIKQELFILLKEIKAVCEEHNIRYYLGCGTLLGAVRHKGFIPWDDDIDILMPRSDYNRFIELQKNGLLKNTLFCNELNKKYKYPFAKYSKNGTHIKEGILSAGKFGVFIDIFPMDGLGDTEIEVKKALKKMQPHVSFQWVGLINPWLKVLSFLFPPLFITAMLHNFFLKKVNKIATSKPFDAHSYVGVMVYSGSETFIMPKRLYDGTTMLPFEGEDFAVPSGYREWLELHFGKDYMTPPPISKRKGHGFKTYVF